MDYYQVFLRKLPQKIFLKNALQNCTGGTPTKLCSQACKSREITKSEQFCLYFEKMVYKDPENEEHTIDKLNDENTVHGRWG